ncbi:MAG: TniQ family protein [Pseudomonadota bacterium]|nr:TniQ family protein [Pseudomonadota bacterium]
MQHLLVRTPAPLSNESLFGFVLRVSEANGYDSPRHPLRLADIFRGQVFSAGFPVDRFAQVLGVNGDELSAIAHRKDQGASRQYKILGHNLGRSLRNAPLRLRRPAFCSQCVEEAGYINAFWDLEAAIACPTHRCLVTRHCPICAKPVDWRRPGLLKCRCGAQLKSKPLPPPEEAIIELMGFLKAKLHDLPLTDLPNTCGFPVPWLDALPLRWLLELLHLLGPRNLEEGEGIDRGMLPVIAAAANILEQWPLGYHRFLTKIGNQFLARNPASAGLTKQFAPFYNEILKNTAVSKHAAFLKQEFINFGLLHWGNATVDKRLLRDRELSRNQRFLSVSEYAKRFGIWVPTMKRMVADGIVVSTRVKTKTGSRLVIDVEQSRPPVATDVVLSGREAAKYAGLPVRVLHQLRKSKVFETRPRRGRHAAWHRDDLEDFVSRGLGLETTPASAVSTLSLKKAMQLKLRSAAAKAAVVAAVFEGSLSIRGRVGKDLGGLLLDKQELDALVVTKRIEVEGKTYSLPEAAKATGLDLRVMTDAIRKRLLTVVSCGGRMRVPESAIERFNASYVALSQIAKQRGTSGKRLYQKCREEGIPVMTVSRGNHAPAQPILRRGDLPQLLERWDLYAKSRPKSHAKKKEDCLGVLRKYLQDLRDNGKKLPRLIADRPNKVAIAAACGFSRHVLYAYPAVVAMLQEFDESERQSGAGDAPFVMFKRYLNKLRDSGQTLPRYGGKLNKVAIAKAGNFCRDAFYKNPEIAAHLKAYASMELV